MKNYLSLGLILVLGLFASCQTATSYKSAENSNNKYGYTDTKLADNLYRVAFSGNAETSRAQVEDFMILRAAELAKKKGKHYLKFTEKDTEVTRDVETFRRSGFDYRGVYGRPGFANYSYPYYMYGGAWAPHATQTRIEKEYKVIAYVKFYDKISDAKGLISADEVIKNIPTKTD